MTAIGPGDWVECVDGGDDDDPSTWTYDDHAPSIGCVYRVEEIDWSGGLIIFGFEQIDPDWQERVAWDADNFRPIYRPKSSLIDGLKKPVSEFERDNILIDMMSAPVCISEIIDMDEVRKAFE